MVAGVSNVMIVGGTGQSVLQTIGGTNVLVAGSADSWLTGCTQGAGSDTFQARIIPGRSSWTGITNCVNQLRELGFRISVDSFDESEVTAAVSAGAELVLSVNGTNINSAKRLKNINPSIEVVAIPDTPIR